MAYEPALPMADINYFLRRLSETRRIPGLSPVLQFEIAQLPIDDDQLDEVATAFGAESKTGWGFSDLLERTLSQEREKVTVDDLKTLQQSLVDQGYAPPGTEVDGNWTSSWQGMFRRMDRDSEEAIRSGHSWSGGPVVAGVRFITNTLPPRVWQGIVGTAKGIALQTSETVGRVGALGGAAAGAAIGSIVPGVGTAAGAVGGAIVGFLGDIFTGGEEEEDQGPIDKIVDALTPFEEYADDPRAFWEDLGYVGSAAALVSGGQMAVSGYKAGMAGIKAATVVETPSAIPLVSRMFPGSFETGTAQTIRTMGEAAIKKQLPVLPEGLTASQQFIAQGPQVGVFSRIATWATQKFAPGTAGHIRDWIATHGLLAQQTRPGLQLINKMYTGPMAASLSARFAAGFTGPRVSQWQGTTTIEKAITDTDVLGEGTIIEDLANLSSFLIIPERFLPWAKGSVPQALDRLAGTDEASKYSRMFPFAHVSQKEGQSFSGAFREVLDYMTPPRELFHRVNYGIDYAAKERVAGSFGGSLLRSVGLSTKRLEASARYDIIRRLHETVARGDTTFEKKLIALSFTHEFDFTKFLTELGMQGSGIERIKFYDEAEKITLWVDRGLDKRTLVDVDNIVMPALAAPTVERPLSLASRAFPGSYESATVLTGRRLPRVPSGPAFEREELLTTLSRYTADAKKLRSQAARSGDQNLVMDYLERARGLEDDSRIIKTELAALGKTRAAELQGPENMRVAAMRLDTPTRAEYLRYRDQYLQLRERSMAAWKADPASREAQQAFNDVRVFLDDLSKKGLVPHDLTIKSLGPRPGKEVAKFLEEEASYAARDLVLDEETTARLRALGYKPVLAGEDLVFIEDVDKLSEAYGLAEYSRKAALIETLGFSPRWRNNIDVFQARVASEEAEVGNVLQDFPVSPQKAVSLLHAQVDKINHSGATKGPFVIPAGAAQKGRLFKTDLRDLSVDDIYTTPGLQDLPGFTIETAQRLFRAIRRGAALGGEVRMMHPVESLRVMGRAMRVNGLPGFSDAIRTIHTKDPAGWTFVKWGAGIGAGEGMYEDIKQGKPLAEIVRDTVTGAAKGAALGAGLKMLAKKNYGYLPDLLVRVNTALRFSLSLTFDAGRYMEQNMIAHAKYGLPFIINPRNYIKSLAREGNFRFMGATITDPKDAWRATMEFWDEINGTNFFRVIDDIDRRMYQVGLLAFSPRDWEAAQAVMLHQQGMRMSEIRDAVSHIGRYGPGRTAAEKSANFIFFPFSFSKKLLSTMGDFMMQAPARALLLHEGWRRYTESTLRDDVTGFLEDHVPILSKLWTINNLSYGLSPGRFFLEGLEDDRTILGKTMFTLGTVFVPSGGAATTAAQAAGAIGDLSVLGFTPIIVTGESIKRAGGAAGLLDIMKQYVPLTREINTYFFGNGPFLGETSGIGAQMKAMPTWFGGQGLSPYSQYQDYLDELREYKDELEPFAIALGYTSVDGLLGSDVGLPLKARFDEYRLELMKKYPTGASMSQEFENSVLTRERAVQDLVEKVNKSEGEEAILRIADEEWKWRMVARTVSLPTEIVSSLAAKRIREFALKYAGDRRFRELYKYLYEYKYGPIVTTKVV